MRDMRKAEGLASSSPATPRCNCKAMALSGNGPMPQNCDDPNCQYFKGAPATGQPPHCRLCGDSEEAIIHHLDEDDEVGHKFEPSAAPAPESPETFYDECEYCHATQQPHDPACPKYVEPESAPESPLPQNSESEVMPTETDKGKTCERIPRSSGSDSAASLKTSGLAEVALEEVAREIPADEEALIVTFAARLTNTAICNREKSCPENDAVNRRILRDVLHAYAAILSSRSGAGEPKGGTENA